MGVLFFCRFVSQRLLFPDATTRSTHHHQTDAGFTEVSFLFDVLVTLIFLDATRERKRMTCIHALRKPNNNNNNNNNNK